MWQNLEMERTARLTDVNYPVKEGDELWWMEGITSLIIEATGQSE